MGGGGNPMEVGGERPCDVRPIPHRALVVGAPVGIGQECVVERRIEPAVDLVIAARLLERGQRRASHQLAHANRAIERTPRAQRVCHAARRTLARVVPSLQIQDAPVA
jgi:hypothetical protein